MGKIKYNTDEERKQARRESAKRWHARHPLNSEEPANWLRRKKNNRRAYANQVARNWEIISKFKNVPCMDCGNKFPLECMDFDHVRGEKLFTIGTQGKKLSAKKTDILLDEIAKCDVVCANCHRIRTRMRILEKQKQLDLASKMVIQ